MTHGIALLLAFVLFYFPCCNGDELTYFVHPIGKETSCPDITDPAHCRLLSDYARDNNLSLDSNTSFVFIPGEHVLDAALFVNSSVEDISLRPMDPRNDVLITCENGAFFIFLHIRSVEVMFLTFHSCKGRYFDQVLFIRDVETTIVHHCTFINNTDTTAVDAEYSTLLFTENQVSHNFGGLMYLVNCLVTFTDNVFTDNEDFTSTSYGSLVILMSTLTATGTNVFSGNSGVFTGSMFAFYSTINLGGNATFVNNHATIGGTLYGLESVINVSGNATFANNHGEIASVVGMNSTIIMDGNATFVDNQGENAGVITASTSHLVFSGRAYFENNTGTYGGVLNSVGSQVTVSGELAFLNNHASYGGAFHIVASTVTFTNNATFSNNTATDGGAIFLSSGSNINFLANEPGSVTFMDNFANRRGGAIFIQDSNTLSYCTNDPFSNVVLQKCSFTTTDFDQTVKYRTRMFFLRNYATEAGTAIYGGALHECILITSSDDATHKGEELFDQIADYSDNDRDTGVSPSSLSSDPFKVCGCNGSEPNCDMTSLSYTIYSGAVVHVTVVGLGQRNGAVPSTIVATEHDLAIEDLEMAQAIPNECSNLSYTVYARPGNASLELFSGGSCLTQGIGLTIEFKVLNCPPGFVMKAVANNKEACICDSRLLRYTNTCNPNDGTILRDDTFWVGYDQDSGGVILYSTCPFDYCTTDEKSFKVEDGDAQCNYNREGLLCGQCSDGRSIVLGSSRCKRCSDSYLALLLFFAAAGVILVAFLLLLNLTVATGTINGLICYANIVASDLSVLYPTDPNTYLDILKVFIAWINLDFGIESCFYNGMDAYAKTWLDYVFPFYIWILIGLVFVVSHFSSTASRYLGTNPVSVFATLILLSYTKILRTIIETFSSATLDFPEGETKLVWLYDGNIPFLDVEDGRHLGLFVASLLILVVLFIPYTLLLLTSQWLQIKSHWKILSWLNRPQLRAFLDAYHAPYKPRHRYWTGLLLLVRFVLLITSARTMATNPSVNFLVAQVFVLLVLMWALINGGVYKKWYLNALEAFFFLNLALFAACTHHIKFEFATKELSSSESQRALAISSSISITLAALTFMGIVAFHIYQKKAFRIKRKSPPNVEMREPAEKTVQVTITSNSVSLREPLLDES